MKKGNLIIFVAPTGGGKSTLLKKLRPRFSQVVESISTTTRKMREGEKHGVNYYFVDINLFEEGIKKGQFLEYAKVHGNYYGTSKTVVQDALNSGKNLFFDIDVQGADAIKKVFGEQCHIIFIAPPSLEVSEARVRARGTEDEATIQVRMATARNEMKRMNDFDYLVINDDLEVCYKELETIISKIIE